MFLRHEGIHPLVLPYVWDVAMPPTVPIESKDTHRNVLVH